METRQFQTEQQNQLTQWISEHQETYVSHAVWSDNIELLLGDGILRPGEEQLRQRGFVSYEQGASFSERGQVTISKESLEALKEEKDLADLNRLISSDRIPLTLAKEFSFISEQECKKWVDDKPPQSIQLKDGKEYVIEYVNGQAFIKGIPCLEFNELGAQKNFHTIISTLAHKHQCPRAILQLAQDCLSAEPVDKRLAQLWNTYRELSISSDHRKIARQLYQWRKLQFEYLYKLNNDIRFSYRRIDWHYGEVVVLKGQSEAILSICNKANHQEYLTYKPEEMVFAPGAEVSSLHPFENNGNFFSLSLAKPDCIVIGPKAALAPYASKACSNNIRLFYIEDMNKEQRNFFNIPGYLEKQKYETTFNQFVHLYRLSYDSQNFIKRLFLRYFGNTLQAKLDKGLITSMDDIEEYAQQNSTGRTAAILKIIQKTRPREHCGNVATFEQHYTATYNNCGFFKNPCSAMRLKIKKNEIFSINDVREHAVQNLSSRTAHILLSQ